MSNKSFKITIFILTSTLIIFAAIKFNKIERYIKEERYYSIFSAIGLTERCYNPYKDIKILFIQEKIDYEASDQEITSESLEKILSFSPYKNIQNKIPYITHHIYFSKNIENKDKLNDFYVEKMKANFNKLNDNNEIWQHNIWTNNPDIFPKELAQIKGVEIRDISIFNKNPSYQILLKTLNKFDQTKLPLYLAESSDILRLIALQELGGIYNDMDYEIYDSKQLKNYMHEFDFIGGRDKISNYSYYANSFLAAKPSHPVINEAITMMIINHTKPKTVPDYIKYPCTENDRLYFNGPPLITLSYFKKNNINGNNDLILPAWMIFNIAFAHNKNKTCDYNSVKKEFFDENNSFLKLLIKNFAQNITHQEINKFYRLKTEQEKNNLANIYYSLKDREIFPIIGADMGCGTWVTETKPRIWHWK